MNALLNSETETEADDLTLSLQIVGPADFCAPQIINPVFPEKTDLEALQIRMGILTMEAAMIALPEARFGNQDDCPLTHSFAGPIYTRQMLLPKGYLITGKIHRQEHPIFVLSGDVSVVDEYTGLKRIKGPCYYISKSGAKRLIYAHEDTVFVTIHYVGDERDIDRIENLITTDTYEDYRKGLQCSETKNLSNG